MILASFWWICILKNLGTRTIVREKYVLITKRGYKMKKRIISLFMCGVLAVATLAGGEAGLMLVGATDIEQEDILPEMALEVTPEAIAAGSDELGAEAIEPEVTATPTLIPTATPEVVEEVEPEATAEPEVTAEPEMTGGVTPEVTEEGIPEVTLIPENEKDLSRSARAAGDVAINATNFPDKNFRKYIAKKYDENKDGVLSKKEQDSVLKINIPYVEESEPVIRNLKGVEFFINLETLDCINTGVTDLDVSKNTKLEHLSVYSSPVKKLDLRKNTKLKHLDVGSSDVKKLDLRKNTKLEYLCFMYSSIKTLDLSKNTELLTVIGWGSDLLELKLPQNSKLEALYCDNNELVSLDVSNQKKLKHLDVDENKITSLDVRNSAELEFLSCKSNELTDIDVSNNAKLEELHIDENKIAKINISSNEKLRVLYCSENKLTKINTSKNPKLYWLSARKNKISGLDVSKNPELGVLYCEDNKISSIKGLDKCIKMEYLWISNNKLKSIPSLQNMNELGYDQDTLLEDAHWFNINGNYFTASELKAKLPKRFLTNKQWLKTVVDSQKLVKQEEVKLSNQSANSLKITWKQTPDAKGYEVHRATSKNGAYKAIQTVKGAKTLSYTDKKLKNGATYYYKVRAYKTVNAKKVYGAYSDIVSKKANLAKPTLTVESKSNSAINLSWKKVSGATKYEIHRATSEKGKYKKIKTTTKVNYTNTGLSKNKKYYYKVVAVQKISGKTYTSTSAIKSAKPKK